MSVHPTFPGGDPNKPWDKQPWDTASPQKNDTSEGGVVSEAVGSVVEGVAEAATYGCLEGCGSCSCAVFVALFLVAGTAMAAGLLN